MIQKFVALALMVFVVACTNSADLKDPPADLGNFKLGHNVVVASKMKQALLSRGASEEEWVAAISAAVEERFGRYDGDHLYHIGISVEGFSIAPPGIPLVASPKSILIIRATVWDDRLGKKLTDEPKQFTVFESLSGETLLGSGLTKSKEEQMQNLARNAAKLVQNWMSQNPDWFPGIGESVETEAPMKKETEVIKEAAES